MMQGKSPLPDGAGRRLRGPDLREIRRSRRLVRQRSLFASVLPSLESIENFDFLSI